MAEAIVTFALQQLTDIARKQIVEEVKLVRGVEKEIRHLSSDLKTIQNVLSDAESRGYKEKTVRRWLNKLEATSYDLADVLDEWNYAILKRRFEGDDGISVPKPKVCPFIPSSCIGFEKVATRRDIAKKIKGLKEKMDEIVREKDRYNFIVDKPNELRDLNQGQTTHVVDITEKYGREDEKNNLVSELIYKGSGKGELGPRIVSIVGPGGIGKTTIAQLVYNDSRVAKHFRKSIWVCVSNISDEISIAKGIVQQVAPSPPDLTELTPLMKCVEDYISGEMFLLILDDVWEEYCTKWESLKTILKRGHPGSKILVTTRSERVAYLMGASRNDIHQLGQLSEGDCWLLMSRIAFTGRREEDCRKLQETGEKIAKRCQGLPLAAQVLGSLLRFKDTLEEWEDVLNSEIWELEKAEDELFPHLFLSYNELSPTMKRCFSFCAMYPKDFEIDGEKLIRMWMALGFLSSSDGNTGDLELKGKEYFENLRMRSFFQKFHPPHGRSYYKMHDIIHDFAQFLTKTKTRDLEYHDDRAGITISEHSEQDPKSSLMSLIKVHRSLFFQYQHSVDHPFHCASGLRVLTLSKCYLNEIPRDVENLVHLRYLDLSENPVLGKIPQSICKLYFLETLHFNCCSLTEIPREIGNLVNLRHLDLSRNGRIEELPETVYNLYDLRILNLSYSVIKIVPEGIDRLVNLVHFINDRTIGCKRLPQGLEKLTGLRTLSEFHAGGGHGKLGWLNKLDQISGHITLWINVPGVQDVIEAQKAELKNKKGIRSLDLLFNMEIGGRDEEKSMIWDDFMEALDPPPYLQELTIQSCEGTKFPRWMIASMPLPSSSFLNHLRSLRIWNSFRCLTLPPLGRLPYLESLVIIGMEGLEFLSREFLGISSTTHVAASSSHDHNMPLPSSSLSSSAADINVSSAGFPKLRRLRFHGCSNWREWEDITDEEQVRSMVSIMPCLTELEINYCFSLKVLPHRLLRKASSLESLYFNGVAKSSSSWSN